MAGNEWQRLAEFIAERMTNTNMNQADLIERSGLSQPTIASLIAGEPRAQSPRPKTLGQLEDGLGWRRGSVADILAGGVPVAAHQTGSDSGRAVSDDPSTVGHPVSTVDAEQLLARIQAMQEQHERRIEALIGRLTGGAHDDEQPSRHRVKGQQR